MTRGSWPKDQTSSSQPCTGVVPKLSTRMDSSAAFLQLNSTAIRWQRLGRLSSVTSSVEDPGCLSRIADPDFYPSRIPDPKTATKERDEKKIFVIPFYVATNFTKLKIILVLKCRRKKFWQIFKELYNFLPKKSSLSSHKYGFGIRDPEKPIPDPGSRGQKGSGCRIRIRNTGYQGF